MSFVKSTILGGFAWPSSVSVSLRTSLSYRVLLSRPFSEVATGVDIFYFYLRVSHFYFALQVRVTYIRVVVLLWPTSGIHYCSYFILITFITFIAHSRALFGRTTVSRLGHWESKHSFALSSCLQRVIYESFSGSELEAWKGLDTFSRGENFGGVERSWSSNFRVDRRNFFSFIYFV